MEPTGAVLFLLGASHHTAPLAIREKLALDEARAATLADKMRALPGVKEFTLLNTCNRVEIYGVTHQPETIAVLRQAVAETTGCAPGDLENVLHLRQNHDAIAHLQPGTDDPDLLAAQTTAVTTFIAGVFTRLVSGDRTINDAEQLSRLLEAVATAVSKTPTQAPD